MAKCGCRDAGQADAAPGWPFAFAAGAQSARGVSGRYRHGPADRGPGNCADRRRHDLGRDGERRLARAVAQGRQPSRCFGVCAGGVGLKSSGLGCEVFGHFNRGAAETFGADDGSHHIGMRRSVSPKSAYAKQTGRLASPV
jgi:hypothetical protein